MSIAIHFDPTEGIYTMEGEGVLQTKKYLEIEDVRDILLSNVSLDTGILPQGCKYYLKQDGKTIVVLEYPSVKKKILYRRGRTVNEYMVSTPNTIFGLVLEGGTLIESFCATTKFPLSSNATELFRFPFGNVYGDLRICWGNAETPNVRNVVESSQFPILFYEAPFNGDLSDGAFRYDGSLGDYLSFIDGQEHFPLNTLRESGQTFEDLLNRMKRAAGLI